MSYMSIEFKCTTILSSEFSYLVMKVWFVMTFPSKLTLYVLLLAENSSAGSLYSVFNTLTRFDNVRLGMSGLDVT